MAKIFTVLLLIALFFLPGMVFGQAYVTRQQDEVHAGNEFFEIEFSLSGKRLQVLELVNKRSQNRYRLSGNVFRLRVSYPGVDITPPRNSPANRSAADFVVKEVKIAAGVDGKDLQFLLEGHGLSLVLHQEIPESQPYFRSYLEIKDPEGSGIFLEKISVLDIRIDGFAGRFGGFGQPVFGEDLFLGVEFPAAYTTAGENGRVNCWHRVAQKLPVEQFYRSHSAIIGFSGFHRVRESFFRYIEKLRPRPTRPFALYNTWYDIRKFSYPELLNTIDHFKSTLFDRYGLQLDAFVIDDGWDKVHSLWEIDRSIFPRGFDPIVQRLARMNSKMGLWISPWNGYGSARKQRVDWAKEHGYRPSGNHLCLGSEKYYRAFTGKVLEYLKAADLSFYKIDGFLSVCNESDHQHVPGIYSREFLTRRFVEVLKAIRREKPDIFIDITVGTWLSPWWLMYADAVWMTGADFGHAEDVPAFSERDKAITFRDYTLYKDFQRDGLQFPLANVMTHGIIKGKLNLLGGKDETLRNWQDNAVMYFSRGVMMWELYISPEILNSAEWDFLAAMMKWGYANQEILMNTRFVGGNPYRREIYGYFHQGKDESLFIVRNPFVAPQQIAFRLNELFNSPPDTAFVVEEIYPSRIVSGNRFSFAKPLSIDLQGYEVKVIRLLPVKKINYALPSGVYIKSLERNKKQYSYRVYLNPGEKKAVGFVGKKWLKRLKFNGRNINVDEFATAVRKASEDVPASSGYSLQFERFSRAGVSATLVPPAKVELQEGRIGILLDFSEPVDSLQIKIHPVDSPAGVTIKKGAEGAWYWVLIPVEKITSALKWQISPVTLPQLPAGRISLWELGNLPLKVLGILTVESRNPAPVEKRTIPVSAGQKRITRRIFSGEL